MKEKMCYELNGETMVIHLPRELDHHVVQMIRNQTDCFFDSKRIRNVVFDYGNTSFMDSSGIGLVMGKYKEVRYLNGNIYIACVNQRVARVLEISGLYRVAILVKNVEEAFEEIEEVNEKVSV
ncbi:MAG: STAS domain-containing protein [Lachnospiraceae bacterium]|nr:STAS domain-containing protein [Lachnospiraceae bacterium]